MDSRITSIIPKASIGELCDTIFYQGNGGSQTQSLKYIGDQVIEATTREKMWCTGRNNFPPFKVIYKLYLGKEIADVDLHPKVFDTTVPFFHPIKLLGMTITWASNWLNGFHFSSPTTASAESVVFHAPILTQVSIGQETDMLSHRRKYDAWLQQEDKTDGLILYGVSRGTAATFCAFAKEKYPEVRLVVLEGAIDSVEKVILTRYKRCANFISSGLSIFKRLGFAQYNKDGTSPLKSIENFPESVPVVFITSKVDKVVTCGNTENIANALAKKGKNDVYLLKLERSSHPNYMFDDAEDRNTYEVFIHAIYKKYNLRHNPDLAKKGEHLLALCTLSEVKYDNLKKVV